MAPNDEWPRQERRWSWTARLLIAIFWILSLVASLFLILPFVSSLFPPSSPPYLISLDWSGYVVVSDLQNPQPVFEGVNASWIVPQVTPTQEDSFSATWIGIGGQLDGTLIQAGTEQDFLSGTPTYSAWYELLPVDSVTISTINVSPGDRISASISLLDSSMNEWSIEIEDLTNGQGFKSNVYYSSSRLSADWIVERPTVNNILSTLADFGSITFTNSGTTTNAASQPISAFPFTQEIMHDRQNNPLVTVSPLNSDGTGFTVSNL
jgi:hypothetical protein